MRRSLRYAFYVIRDCQDVVRHAVKDWQAHLFFEVPYTAWRVYVRTNEKPVAIGNGWRPESRCSAKSQHRDEYIAALVFQDKRIRTITTRAGGNVVRLKRGDLTGRAAQRDHAEVKLCRVFKNAGDKKRLPCKYAHR